MDQNLTFRSTGFSKIEEVALIWKNRFTRQGLPNGQNIINGVVKLNGIKILEVISDTASTMHSVY